MFRPSAVGLLRTCSTIVQLYTTDNWTDSFELWLRRQRNECIPIYTNEMHAYIVSVQHSRRLFASIYIYKWWDTQLTERYTLASTRKKKYIYEKINMADREKSFYIFFVCRVCALVVYFALGTFYLICHAIGFGRSAHENILLSWLLLLPMLPHDAFNATNFCQVYECCTLCSFFYFSLTLSLPLPFSIWVHSLDIVHITWNFYLVTSQRKIINARCVHFQQL